MLADQPCKIFDCVQFSAKLCVWNSKFLHMRDSLACIQDFDSSPDTVAQYSRPAGLAAI